MSEVSAEEGQFNIVEEITNAIHIIDHAANEGAFKGWDNIQKVLANRARLQAFVVAVGQVTAEEAGETPVSQDVAPSTDEEG